MFLEYLAPRVDKSLCKTSIRLCHYASGGHEAAPSALAALKLDAQHIPRIVPSIAQRGVAKAHPNGADSRPRTDDIEFGKLTLCQLSYVRKFVRLATIQ